MIVNSNGLMVLTKDQYINSIFILYCDSSMRSWGACLCALINDTLFPVAAISKSHNKNARKFCINKLELISCIYASEDLRVLLEGRAHFLAVDSAFARYCLTKPIDEITSKVRGAILIYRERFHSRVLKVPGDKNWADILSRYTIPSVASTGINTEQDRKILKTHMGDTKLDDDVLQSIMEQSADLLNPDSITPSDEIIKKGLCTMPECYSISALNTEIEDCEQPDICCFADQSSCSADRDLCLADRHICCITELRSTQKSKNIDCMIQKATILPKNVVPFSQNTSENHQNTHTCTSTLAESDFVSKTGQNFRLVGMTGQNNPENGQKK